MCKYNLDNPHTELVEEEGDESDGPEPQRWVDPNPPLESRHDSVQSATSFRNKRRDGGGGDDVRGNSRGLNIVVKGEVERSGKVGDKNSQIDQEKRNVSRSGEASEIGVTGMTPGWSLPFGSSYPKASLSVITQEFNRLDLLGEGRLTYLTLKSALELREIQTSDSTVRRWLKENDRGGKLGGRQFFGVYFSVYALISFSLLYMLLTTIVFMSISYLINYSSANKIQGRVMSISVTTAASTQTMKWTLTRTRTAQVDMTIKVLVPILTKSSP